MTFLAAVGVWLFGSIALGLSVGSILHLAQNCQVAEEQALTFWEKSHGSTSAGKIDTRAQVRPSALSLGLN